MAPEVMKGLNHTGSVDYFAVGVITYELMMGKRPYLGKSRKEIKEQMMSKQIYLNTDMIPSGWSEESADFINQLMIRKDVKRLGFYNELDIQNHPWFSDINFDKIIKKELMSPFLPRINHDNYDKKYCEEIEKIGFETNYRYEEYKANEHYRDIFLGFTFYNVDESKFKIYRKPSIKYIQNKKYKITENLKDKKSKTIYIDKTKDELSFNKKSTIDYDYLFNDKEKDTIEVDNYYNVINDKKNIYNNDKGNSIQNYSSNKHKRIKSNLVGHNFLFFLQKRKLFYSNENNQNINNKSSNNNESNLFNTMKLKNSSAINYHKIKKKEEKKVYHGHANSFSNNIYLNLISKIRKEKSNLEELIDKNIIEDIKSSDKKSKKKTIDISKVPKLLKIENNNYRNFKYIKKKTKNEHLSIESVDSFKNSSNKKNTHELTEKINMMKATTNFYMKHKIPHTQLNKLITPNTSKNKKMLLNIKTNINNKFISLNNDKTIENSSKRKNIKIRTKSFSKNSYLDNSNQYQKILNLIYSEGQSLDKNNCNKRERENKKPIYQKIIKPEIKHNNSYSSFNNKNKIELLINNIFTSDKNKKSTIPVTFKKSSNTLVNSSKVSNLHKKIPMPLKLGQRIFQKRINGAIERKMLTPMTNNLSTTNNNSISNSSISKNFIFNKNNSSSKTSRKVKPNIIINSYINNGNYLTINSNKKKMIKFSLNSNNTNNYTSLIKKIGDFSIEHRKNATIGNNIIFPKSKKNIFEKSNKINKLEKFSIKNKLLNGHIKKVGNSNIRKKFNEDLMNIKKKEQNEFKEDYTKINNIILNQKISNCNSKNKINSNNKSIKSSNIPSFSYHSYNSTTSSGCKINNK